MGLGASATSSSGGCLADRTKPSGSWTAAAVLLAAVFHCAAGTCQAPFTASTSIPGFCFAVGPSTVTWARAMSSCRQLHRNATLAQLDDESSASTLASEMPLTSSTSYWMSGVLDSSGSYFNSLGDDVCASLLASRERLVLYARARGYPAQRTASLRANLSAAIHATILQALDMHLMTMFFRSRPIRPSLC